MSVDRTAAWQRSLDALDRGLPESIPELLDALLHEAVRRGASDLHLEPTHRSLEVRFRLDGVLHRAATLRKELAPNLIARLKVLAELLTYRNDVPQEGRLHWSHAPAGSAMRVSTFPTIHGEKAAIRLFDAESQVFDLDQLALPAAVRGELDRLLASPSGAILLTGPSGSGKTTTIYACLRHLVKTGDGGRHIVTLEDPVEQVLEGVSQAQARPGSEFDFARGLRSLLRQDPEVVMIGEIRDPDTAGIAIEAALTGHLVFSTLHAGSACGVLGRLLDMGVEPYLLTSGVRGILNQRLVRRVCPQCRQSDGEPAGCDACAGTGYRGRLLLAELLTLHPALRRAVLAKADLFALQAAAAEAPQPTLAEAADDAVKRGVTTRSEIVRVLGRDAEGSPS
jgi:type II secretory ATPase GspE/PulE/Tfp pilus assembly ATPase PilB-like protein